MKRRKHPIRWAAMLLCLCTLLPLANLLVFADDTYPYHYPEITSKPYYQMSMYAYQLEEKYQSNQLSYPTSIMRLLDTENENQQVLAYCADSDIYDEYGYNYRVVELEDLTSTAANARNLRAVIRNSYPFLTKEAMIDRIEASGIELHADRIPHYEMVLITSVQQTIYAYTNPETYIGNPFAGAIATTDYRNNYQSMILNPPQNYSQENIYNAGLYPDIRADVLAIIDWLKNLPAEDASEPDASFTAVIGPAGGGDYTLTLTLSEAARQAEDLTASVSAGGSEIWNGSITPDPNGVCEIKLSGENLPSGSEVSVVLSGTAVCDDVIAYESETNGFTQSQPLIGAGSIPRTFTSDAVTAQPSSAIIQIVPADLTIYMGGEGGYDAVVGDSEEPVQNNSLPRPLFYLYAPDGVNPEALTFTSEQTVPGTQEPKQWTVQKAGEDRSGQALYYLNKVHEAQDEVRVQYTIGDEVFVDDQFEPSAVQDLFEDYTIELYTNTLNPSQIVATAEGSATVYGLQLGTGTLRVRAVENGDYTPQTNPVYDVQDTAPADKLPSGTAAITAPSGTTYVLNHTTVDVPANGVALLFDDIYDRDNGQGLRETALIEGADNQLGPVAQGRERFHQAKYLDLVDTQNGNAWVKTTGAAVTVYWAYPEGTDSSTDFTLLHFKNLHRDDADGANSGYSVDDIAQVTPDVVNITKGEAGISFSVESGGFSPFVLVWEKATTTHRPPTGGGSDDPGSPLVPSDPVNSSEPPAESSEPPQSEPAQSEPPQSEPPQSEPAQSEPPQSESPEETPEPPRDPVPQTGDSGWMAFLLPLCAVSGTAALLCSRKRFLKLHK